MKTSLYHPCAPSRHPCGGRDPEKVRCARRKFLDSCLRRNDQLLFGCAVAVAILVGSTLPAVAQQPSAAAEVRELLSTRVAAVNNGDEVAFMNTLDPRAPQQLRDGQLREFRGLRSLPLRDFTLGLNRIGAFDAAPGLDLAERYGADAAYLPETRRTFRIGEFDDRPHVDTLWSTYVERDGEWFVAGNNDGAIVGLQSTPNIWGLHDIAVIESEHFITLHRPDQDERAVNLSAIAEQAMSEFQPGWDRPWSQRIPVIVPSSPEDAAALLDTDADVAGFVAFVTYRTMREQEWSISAPRMFAQDANLADNSVNSQVGTVVHELVHAASAPLAGPFTPAWLHEGVAEYVRSGEQLGVAPSAQGELRLPPAGEFSAGGDRLRSAYGDAHSAMSFLAELHGEDAPVRLFETVGARRLVTGTPSYNVDQAFRQVTGTSLADFEAAWNARHSREGGNPET